MKKQYTYQPTMNWQAPIAAVIAPEFGKGFDYGHVRGVKV